MIKLFEEFKSYNHISKSDKVSNDILGEMLNFLSMLLDKSKWNNKLYQLQLDLAPLGEEPYNFSLQQSIDFRDYDFNQLSNEDRNKISDIYNSVYRDFKLDLFPDLDELLDILIPLNDLTLISLKIDLEKMSYLFNLPPYQNAENLTRNSILNLTEIFSEILPTYDRIIGFGYKCEFNIHRGSYQFVVTK